ncbi:MAG TPA: inositol monophosphatase family protein, partial [Candidatus Tectomicrobia bacterium]|nr:inositol monophosphatase family protein [Candidatus Tectomicrobia bacterium]
MLIDRVAVLMRLAAIEAILPRFRRLERHEIAEKSPGEVVTAADAHAERLLAPRLCDLLPGSRVVGEEAAAADPSLLEGLASGTVWLVDPLDGTANFAAGRPPFAVMVALLRDGVTTTAWILDPVTDALAVAERGAGAFLDGARVRVAPDDREARVLDDAGAARVPHHAGAALVRGSVSARFLPADHQASIARRAAGIATLLPGFLCAGREYPAIVTAERDFALFWRVLP